MYFTYFGFTSQLGECSVTISKTAQETAGGRKYAEHHTWVVDGFLTADTIADVAIACNARIALFSTWFGDAALVSSGGVVLHTLPNGSSYTGVRVTQPCSFPQGTGAEGTTFRTWRAVLEASYLTDRPPLYTSFTESLTLRGGGPRLIASDLVVGSARVHVVHERTAYRAVQSGQAVGFLAYPPVPLPIFGIPSNDGGQVEYGHPRPMAGKLVDWPVSWSYEFVSGTPLVGRPNLWRGD